MRVHKNLQSVQYTFIIYNFLQVDMKSFFSLLHLMEILVRSWSVVEIKLHKMIWIYASHK